MFYPVGSFYWSTRSTRPATLFGGTWTQITDTFVYAANAFNATKAGATSATSSSITVSVASSGATTSGSTTLTVNQIPSHKHEWYGVAYNAGYPKGNYTLATAGSAAWGNVGGGVGNTGGGQGHTHSIPNHTHTLTNGTHSHTVSTMPPYITAFCWYRTA